MHYKVVYVHTYVPKSQTQRRTTFKILFNKPPANMHILRHQIRFQQIRHPDRSVGSLISYFSDCTQFMYICWQKEVLTAWRVGRTRRYSGRCPWLSPSEISVFSDVQNRDKTPVGKEDRERLSNRFVIFYNLNPTLLV